MISLLSKYIRLSERNRETVLLAVALWWALTCHRPLLGAALAGRDPLAPGTWGFAVVVLLAATALNTVLLMLLTPGRLLRPVVTLLLVIAAGARYFMEEFGAYLDPSMLRNALRTDLAEARELLSMNFALGLLVQAGLPVLLVWVIPLRERSWGRAIGMRSLWTGGAVVVLVSAVLAVFQPLASLMRNHKEVRYLITPANVLWSAGNVLAADLKGAAKPRQSLGLDAQPGPVMATRARPMVLVIVIGETARAANWGLSGYIRQTTPELAKIPGLINFPQVTSCGTNTEVSLPCMFAPVGRRDYDENRIRGSESLLHVLNRAGVGVLWRDNQSGCKGVCNGLPTEDMTVRNPPGLCADGRCLDEALLTGLDERLAQARGTQVIVLHQLGNHGPSYFRRIPPAFAYYQPVCESDDLRQCEVPAIVNAYDNALRYTDHLLASLIARLQAQADTLDSAFVYISDHGESLGESNLFLHGIPYAIAPDVQKRVPMVMWLSGGMTASARIDTACLRMLAAQPAAHDNLVHTLLGLIDVRTALYEPALDLTADCRLGAGPKVAGQASGRDVD
ncbi:phosphoethanolamine--lipid A transferase [Sphaerotilus montanus]|uniref:Lipid A ethanolaminephosphotransferase n=1 Tax=Sphaerotilus montanus TaxID=522889 RepID=A0A7Y9QWZ8_9BURK|nr:phosphoethanolamine--lipid A transferase [Sphaerotilus montanus]NYG33025.1 lipid A ethanolaminephosphotransferase [Sphaerotilus montanus]NZD57280.1 phosphoethanolamine--lipid A transferase [Sphaerotilus montanus]